MSAVVSDTSPIHYLILIGQIEVLPRLFGEVLIRQGRRAAKDRGIFTLGTIAILDEADLNNLLHFEQAVSALQTTNFRIDPEIMHAVIERVRARKTS